MPIRRASIGGMKWYSGRSGRAGVSSRAGAGARVRTRIRAGGRGARAGVGAGSAGSGSSDKAGAARLGTGSRSTGGRGARGGRGINDWGRDVSSYESCPQYQQSTMYIPTLCPAKEQVSANCFRASCLSSPLHRLSILVCTLSTQTALRSPGLGSVLIDLSEINIFPVTSISVPESLKKARLSACRGGNVAEGQKGQDKSRLGEQHDGGPK